MQANNHEIVGDDYLILGQYAERAYLEYAMSVVKGRALPEVSDGQKPVQRRILYAMYEMGLKHGAKPVKSARVVGDVLGKFHPHGDSSAYEAMVRMAQNFSLRYPLVEGTGNFGSREGDDAAAMRYTEARLSPIAELLLSEVHQGTVDFIANYDGSTQEPVSLPARLPMVLLNGASGIAVGMATEIPAHNLREVGAAAIALLKQPALQTADLMQYIPAPDFATGGHIISSDKELANIYETGRGSVRVRARYEIEKLERGQWRLIVTELPPNTHAQKVLLEIEEQTNPKPKAGKKQLSQEQLNTKKLMLDLIDQVRDACDDQHPVRLIFEPKSARIKPEDFINTLMAQTSLESNVPVSFVMMGMDKRPAQKNLKTILQEWLDFRLLTVTRRLQHRLNQVDKRIHILQGRMTVFLHIDEVIRVIRESDEPKSELMAAFALSEVQAEDILEIRLRQLARLEGFKLEKELNELQEEQCRLHQYLSDDNEKKKLIIKEMQADMKQFGDERRTLVQAAERATLKQSTADEPITLILSKKGWIRSRVGHHLDLSQTAFKEGDGLKQVIESRTVLPVVLLDSLGRSYTIDAADIPRGRGDGVPVSSLVDVQQGAEIVAMLSASPEQHYLLANSGAYGFIVKFADLISRVKAGKILMSLEAGERLLPPVPVLAVSLINPECKVVLASSDHKLLAFSVGELKVMAKGRGLQLMNLGENASLQHLAIVQTAECRVETQGKRGAKYQDNIRIADIENKRGRKGKVLSTSGEIVALSAIENPFE